jgi:hypothetical protein
LDDTTVIQMLSPKLTKTFQDDLTWLSCIIQR